MPSPWVPSVAASGTASRAPATLPVYVGFSVSLLAHHSPQGDRLAGAVSSIKARAPVTGGNFGVWGGMFSTFDCAIKSWRQKEDAWNAILSGFMTGGCLAARSGSNVARTPLCSCLIARWTQVRPRLRRCLWHSPRSIRGRWRPHLTSVQRGKQATDGSSYVPIPSSFPHLTPLSIVPAAMTPASPLAGVQ